MFQKGKKQKEEEYEQGGNTHRQIPAVSLRQESKELGISVLPMPFFINEETFYEDVDLTQETFIRS